MVDVVGHGIEKVSNLLGLCQSFSVVATNLSDRDLLLSTLWSRCSSAHSTQASTLGTGPHNANMLADIRLDIRAIHNFPRTTNGATS